MSDDGGFKISAGGNNVKEMSEQDVRKLGGMFARFLEHWIASTRELMSFPLQVYYFFHDDPEKKVRYHFMRYGIWILYTYATALIIFGVVMFLFTSESAAETVGMLIPVGVFLVMVGGWLPRKIEAEWRVAGNRLAWFPGRGYLGADGNFHPMRWPAFIDKLPQLGPKAPSEKLFNISRNQSGVSLKKGAADATGPAQFLPPAERIPFALGAANAGEKVLRGTKVIEGYAYRQQLEYQARQAGGLSAGLVTFGAVPMRYDAEPQHLMISGKSGAGKSQAINGIIRTARDWRGNAALFADPAGGYLARFGRDTDVVLNPFDLRTENWSPFAEIEFDYDCSVISAATIPDGDGNGGEWNHYAQSLLTEVLRALWKRGEKDPTKVLYYCATAPVEELATLLADTPAAIMTQKGNDRMLGNVRGIISTFMGSWQYLKKAGNFSIRKFVRESDAGGHFLFMTYTDAQMALLKNLIATWMELAIIEGLGLSESNERRLWLVLDELDSLGKISSLKAILTKGRKYGVCCVCGIQTIAQLRSTYGREDAQTLLSCMATKLILPPGESETAEYMSKEIGEQEIERLQVSEGESTKFAEDKTTNTNQHMHRQTQPAVLASQLMSLPNLHGYLRMPGLDVMQIVIPHVKMLDINLPYEPMTQ
jgi:type IV secretory pathway TraG/TraD family ATPase VirD4